MEQTFCTVCGGRTEMRIPPDDDHERAVCTACGTVHYQNPKMVVGCIPVKGDQILMCKRDIEPGRGLWTLPAGYLENGESVQTGAARESFEETGSRVGIVSPYRLYNITRVSQVYFMFIADLLDDNFGPTSESQEVKLVSEDEVPWDDIAFEVIRQTLKDFFTDRRRGQGFEFAVKDLEAKPIKSCCG